MVRDTDDHSTMDDEASGGIANWSRRNVLKITGTGAGIAALGGMSAVGAGQEGNGEHDSGGSKDDGDANDDDGDHFIADLIDPVFGYPLAAGETDDVEIEHVVELTVEEGPGSHENFPEEPDPEAPGQFVEVPAEFVFDPVGLHVRPDELVHFYDAAHLHTATAFHEKFTDPHLDIPTRVPDGVPGFTSPPLTAGESWVYQFTETGVYDLFCFPHLGLGMVMRIVVCDPGDGTGLAAPTAGPLFPNDERVLTAPELDPANVVDAGTVAWDELTLDTGETATDTETETGT